MADMLGDLERLQKLRESGVLNDVEFEAQKSAILSQGQSLGTKESPFANDGNIAASSYSQIDAATVGVFILALAVFWVFTGAFGLFFLKYFLLLSVLSAILLFFDARHIDLQGYDWNRAKWGLTTLPLSLIVIPLYIIKRDEFVAEAEIQYGEKPSVRIKKVYLWLAYIVVFSTFMYQIFPVIANRDIDLSLYNERSVAEGIVASSGDASPGESNGILNAASQSEIASTTIPISYSGGDTCSAIALRDVVAAESPESVIRQGEKQEAVTQYRVDDAGTGFLCSHGGYCYPIHQSVEGNTVTNLKLTNCMIDKSLADQSDGETIYGLKLDRSKLSPSELQYHDLNEFLLQKGLCTACAGSAAFAYMKRPQSQCADLVRDLLRNSEVALQKLKDGSDCY